MTDLRQAAQQALEALESGLAFPTHSDILQNLRTALAMHQVSDFAQAQEQAEPVAWVCMNGEKHDIDFDQPEIDAIPVGTFLYTSPPQRPWVGLTDEDFLEACQLAERGNYLLAFQRIQTKLKERNNG